MTKFTLLSLFPKVYENYLDTSIFKRAVANGACEFKVVDIRDYALNKHKRVDDAPCGGGAGLVMKPEVALAAIRDNRSSDSLVIYLTPRGQVFNQKIAKELAMKKDLIMFAGHYEGIDERVHKEIDMCISIGDYVLTGGELPSLVLLDAITRLLPGVISEHSLTEESFDNDLLEYPQYTLPRIFEDVAVPDVLFSGNHQLIRKYRLKESLRITRQHRPDLLAKRKQSSEEKQLLQEIDDDERNL